MVNANDLMNVLRKSKKRNFTEVEVETLVGEMEARKVVLFGGHGIGIANNKSRVSVNMMLQHRTLSVARSAQSQN